MLCGKIWNINATRMMKNFIDAKQAKLYYKFMNTKKALSHTIANLWFSKQCLNNNAIPKYDKIAIPGNNLPAKKTKCISRNIRIKQEIKFI
jgi:hypothetical protein